MRSNRAGGTIKIRGLLGNPVNLFFEIATQDHNRTTLSEKGSGMGEGRSSILESFAGSCRGVLVGKELEWHSRGQGFDPPQLHFYS